jgi:hypothetical protein
MIVTKEKGVDAAFKRKIQGQVWWPTPVIPALGRLRQGDLEFETNLGFRGGVQSSVHVLGSHSFFFFFFFSHSFLTSSLFLGYRPGVYLIGFFFLMVRLRLPSAISALWLVEIRDSARAALSLNLHPCTESENQAFNPVLCF